MTTDSTTKQQAKSVLEELKRVRDEVKLKLHLAGMEAKETWHKLEPRLEKLEQDVEDAGDNVAAATGKLLTDLGASIRQFADKLKQDDTD